MDIRERRKSLKNSKEEPVSRASSEKPLNTFGACLKYDDRSGGEPVNNGIVGTLALFSTDFAFFKSSTSCQATVARISYDSIVNYSFTNSVLTFRFRKGKRIEISHIGPGFDESDADELLQPAAAPVDPLVALDIAILKMLKTDPSSDANGPGRMTRQRSASFSGPEPLMKPQAPMSKPEMERKGSFSGMFRRKGSDTPPDNGPKFRRGSFGSISNISPVLARRTSVGDVDAALALKSQPTSYSPVSQAKDSNNDAKEWENLVLLCDKKTALQSPKFVKEDERHIQGARCLASWVIHLKALIGKPTMQIPCMLIAAACGIVALLPRQGILYPFFFASLKSYGVRKSTFAFEYDVPIGGNKVASTTFVFQMADPAAFEDDFARQLLASKGKVIPCPASYPPYGQEEEEEDKTTLQQLLAKIAKERLKKTKMQDEAKSSFSSKFGTRLVQNMLEEEETPENSYRELVAESPL